MSATILALIVVASACNSKLLRPPAIVFVDAGERTISTVIGERTHRLPTVFFAFAPSRVPLHPGDALNFQLRDTGEPHTVAMGKIIDSALARVEALGAAADLADFERLDAMRRIPTLFPRSARGPTPKVDRRVVDPCFLDDGFPTRPCEEREQPELDGKQSFYSSGIVEEGEPFRVKLSDDIAPGTYRFMCLVHRAQMAGAIEVVPKTTERPEVAKLRRDAKAEEDEIATTLEPPANTALRRPSGPLLAGTQPRGRTRGLVSAYFPRDAKARVGEPVTWRVLGMHSISFKPNREAKEGALIEDGDTWKANPDAWRPVGSAPIPRIVFAYPPAARRIELDGGTWDGTDEFSSGIIRGSPPASITYTLRISKAGRYAYQCLVHPGMRGTIELT